MQEGRENPRIMERLRSETAEEHRRLEARLDMRKALASPSTYRRLLEGFYGIYAPLEDVLATRLGREWQYRRKLPWLRADLKQLGATEDDIARLPLCQKLPELATPGELLGCLYVVEGSTLGGQVISRMISAALGLAPGSGAAFFAGYGPETPERWREFRGQLEKEVTSNEMADEATKSARATFDTFEKWLTCEA